MCSRLLPAAMPPHTASAWPGKGDGEAWLPTQPAIALFVPILCVAAARPQHRACRADLLLTSHLSCCLAQLQDPNTAVRVRAIYKPRVYGDAGGWHRTPMEWVAYRLNLLLGLDYVPPVAYRWGGRGLPAREGVLDSSVWW